MRAMPVRHDRAPLRASLTPEGFLRDTPVLSRVGIFPYRRADGTTRLEFRPAEEVFKAEHLESLHGKPITDEHHGIIRGDNSHGKVIGTALSAGRQDGENMLGDVVIHVTGATATKKELSLTYELELDETPGEYLGQRYDAVQRNMKINSVALVPKGRAGNARLNLDAADAVFVSTEEETTMPLTKVRLDSAPGIDYEASPEVALALAVATAAVATEKTRADSAEAARDALQVQIAGHDAALAKVREDAAKAVQGRIKLESEAAELGAKFNADAKDSDIRVAVIKAVRGDAFDLTGKSDGYVEASYDLALIDGRKAKANAGTSRAAIVTPRQDGKDAAPVAANARAKMVADMKNTTTTGA
jgi:hypothetical protein